MKYIIFITFAVHLFTNLSYSDIKEADLAGKWYTSNPNDLKNEIKSYIDNAYPENIDGDIVALISPHAGFSYSGPVAAYGYKALEGKTIDTVIVVGFSHKKYYDGIAVLEYDGIKTPLGNIDIDNVITKDLTRENKKIYNYPKAFYDENSIEMQLPFLQVALDKFKVVLIAIGDQSLDNSKILGDSLYNVLKNKKDYLIIASTDLCHYLPYDEANNLDKDTENLIKEFSPDKLSLGIQNRMCGYGAVAAIMIASKKLGADRVEILKYANSGDTSGKKDNVVGYLSAVFIRPKENIMIGQGDKNMLNKEQETKMLKLAREAISTYLRDGKHTNVKESDPVLNKKMGAFVTLHENKMLRGCIGNIIGNQPFYLTVRDMAIEAATGDPRFRPITLKDMDKISIEISALSTLEKIDDPSIIEMGKHGVLVRKGFTSGVYLPQVATETGWSREEFMNSLCGEKAGMNRDAWKKGECEIYIFTAQVFGEEEK